MSEDIGPGDVVVCITSPPLFDAPDGPVPHVGGAYTVRAAIKVGEPHPEDPPAGPAPYDALTLEEIVWTRGGISLHPGWRTECFIKAGKRGSFDSLLEVDAPAKADAFVRELVKT